MRCRGLRHEGVRDTLGVPEVGQVVYLPGLIGRSTLHLRWSNDPPYGFSRPPILSRTRGDGAPPDGLADPRQDR